MSAATFFVKAYSGLRIYSNDLFEQSLFGEAGGMPGKQIVSTGAQSAEITLDF